MKRGMEIMCSLRGSLSSISYVCSDTHIGIRLVEKERVCVFILCGKRERESVCVYFMWRERKREIVDTVGPPGL
jgi:hypothetical protein